MIYLDRVFLLADINVRNFYEVMNICISNLVTVK